MVIFYTTSDRSVGMMEVDEAMLMLPVWMSSTLNALWDEGWVTYIKYIFHLQMQVMCNNCWRFHCIYLRVQKLLWGHRHFLQQGRLPEASAQRWEPACRSQAAQVNSVINSDLVHFPV